MSTPTQTRPSRPPVPDRGERSVSRYQKRLRMTQVFVTLVTVALVIAAVVVFALVAGDAALTLYPAPAAGVMVTMGVGALYLTTRIFVNRGWDEERMRETARKAKVRPERVDDTLCTVLRIFRFVVLGAAALALLVISVFSGVLFKLATTFGVEYVLGGLLVLALLAWAFHHWHHSGPGWEFVRKFFDRDTIFKHAAH